MPILTDLKVNAVKLTHNNTNITKEIHKYMHLYFTRLQLTCVEYIKTPYLYTKKNIDNTTVDNIHMSIYEA